MGILNMFGGSNEPKPIQIHPTGMVVHRDTIIRWLMGATVSAQNPETGFWEEVADPIFDPDINYAANFNSVRGYMAADYAESLVNCTIPAKVVEKPVERVVYRDRPAEPKPAPTAAPTPPWGNAQVFPASAYKRGDIVADSNGRQYLVLGDKADLDPSGDWDAATRLIVIRFDEGMKKSFTTRDANGKHAKDASRNLGRVRGQSALAPVGSDRVLYKRKHDKLYYNRNTGSVEAI